MCTHELINIIIMPISAYLNLWQCQDIGIIVILYLDKLTSQVPTYSIIIALMLLFYRREWCWEDWINKVYTKVWSFHEYPDLVCVNTVMHINWLWLFFHENLHAKYLSCINATSISIHYVKSLVFEYERTIVIDSTFKMFTEWQKGSNCDHQYQWKRHQNLFILLRM